MLDLCNQCFNRGLASMRLRSVRRMENWVQLIHLMVPVSLVNQDEKCCLYEPCTPFIMCR